MRLSPDEPAIGPWRVVPIDELVALLLDTARHDGSRPWIVAIDGRSGSGKSSAADLIHRATEPRSAVVHTDDIAWHHSFFDWSDLLIEGILAPLRNGEAVHYQPPSWCSHGRMGAIEIPAGLDLVVVEGVGANRTEVGQWIDRSIWVQSDLVVSERRGIARDGDSRHARQFWNEWLAEETPFFRLQRPWERASVVVNGTPELPHDRMTEIVVADGSP